MPENPHAATRFTVIRQTPAEKEELRRLADEEGVSVSEWLREAIDLAQRVAARQSSHTLT